MKQGLIVFLTLLCGFAAGLAAGRARWRTSLPIAQGVRAQVIGYQAKSALRGSVMLVGDSLTERTQVSQLCGRPVFNAGISGAKVADLRAVLLPVVAAAKPSAVVIGVGTNDVRSGTPRERFQADLHALAGFSPHTAALIGISDLPGDKTRSREFNAIVKAEAQRRRIAFIEPMPPREGYFLDDGIHHSPLGSVVWRSRLDIGCRP